MADLVYIIIEPDGACGDPECCPQTESVRFVTRDREAALVRLYGERKADGSRRHPYPDATLVAWDMATQMHDLRLELDDRVATA